MKPDTPSRTAEGIAVMRARESARPEGERIFFDPFARHFLSRRIRTIGRIPLLVTFYRWRNRRRFPGMFGGILARTRYIDDHLLECAKNGMEQVVILGAGYDARAYRFEPYLKNARVFEVDRPATQAVKREKLSQILGKLPGHVRFVPCRFNSEDMGEKLALHGYRADRKTLFIWEGVTMYLTPRGVDATLAFVAGQSAPGSSIIFDYFPPSVADGSCTLTEAGNLKRLVDGFGEDLRFGIDPASIVEFMARRGFCNIRDIPAETCRSMYFSGEYATLPITELFHFVHAQVAG